ELEWVGLGHGDILPAETNLHRSGVNQTGGSPTGRVARLDYPTDLAIDHAAQTRHKMEDSISTRDYDDV
ncbi:hypothetical protein, partial [Frigoribacterium sp. UYMn621]|uniref:hypothetical protein n=1 Tax=Frigoribacterium sp. UYMn621 TaxID=3156343 RepID=UPI00339A72FC